MLALSRALLRLARALVPWMMAIKWQALRRGCRPPVRANLEPLLGARESYGRVAESSD